DIQKTAEWLGDLFKQHGFTVNIVKGYDNPIVVAHYITAPSLPTGLIYGHYDVQPAAKEEGWQSEPFTFTERAGRFYARGAIDNKGQVFVHVTTILQLIKEKKLGYNIKFMIEGNEETGSPTLEKFIKENKKLL